jgi:glucuronosyltransferase
MAKAVSRGYGLQLNFNEITEATISAALNELLNNQKYEENMKIASARFNDRPMSPQQTVVYWTEYAARHRGALHLQSQGKSLNFIQYHLLDVYFTILVITIAIIWIDIVIIRCIFHKLCKRTSKQKTH